MFKFNDIINLQKNILKCDQCKVAFNPYDQPRFLPCGETICSTCMFKIEKETINRKFKCVCLLDHYIPDNGFPINKKIYELLTAEPMEISRGKEYEKLQENLNKLQSIAQTLGSDYETGTYLITEYCNEQIRLIQLSTENKIEQINKLSDQLIAFVKEFERNFIEYYLDKNKLLKEEINKIINETNTFINEKQAYLQQLITDDDEIKVFNKASNELQIALNKKSEKLKSLIFNEKLIKFISNNKEINKYALGNFDYEQLREPSNLFSGFRDGAIKLWELKSRKCIKTFLGHNSSVICIKNVFDNILISGDVEGLIKIWKTETGKCLKTIQAHASLVNKIELVSNDRFVTCSHDFTIKLFDLNTFECIRTFIGHEDAVRGINQSSDETIVSCSSDKTIRIWNLNSGECLKILRGHANGVSSITVITDEISKIISGSLREIKVWDVDSGFCLQTFDVGHTNYIKSIIQISNEKTASCDQGGKIIIWNIENGDCLKTIEAHSSIIWNLAKLSNSKIISCDKAIKVWDFETGDCLKTLAASNMEVFCLDLSN